MKSIEQIALEVADSLYGEYGTPFAGLRGVANRFATKFLEQWLAQQTPVARVMDCDVLGNPFIKFFMSLPINTPLFLAPPAAPEGFENAINEAILAEREACAAECERMVMYPRGKQEAPAHDNVWAAAKAIRERGEKK